MTIQRYGKPGLSYGVPARLRRRHAIILCYAPRRKSPAGAAVNKLTLTIVLLTGVTIGSAHAAPALKDCERIFQQSARQNQIAQNVGAKRYGVYGAAAQCNFGKETMPQIERIVAEKRAIRSNSCWTPADEARYQRILIIQKNFVRATAAACVAARNNPAPVAQVQYPSRMSATRD